MKCPHCNKIDHNPYHDNAERNAEAYGGSFFCFKCTKCKKKYKVYYDRKVVRQKPFKADKASDLSFG